MRVVSAARAGDCAPFVQTADAFDAVNLAHDLGQHRGLIAAAGPHFEHSVGARSSQTAEIMRATTQGWEMVCEWPMGSADSS